MSTPGVLSGQSNLVYSASTSGGKSLVSEIILLRTLALNPNSKALFILPFVALCHEKAQFFKELLGALWGGKSGNQGGKKGKSKGNGVGEFYGVLGGNGGLSEGVNLGVCTIEKANSLVNRMMEEGSLRGLKLVIIDELHMVGYWGLGLGFRVLALVFNSQNDKVFHHFPPLISFFPPFFLLKRLEIHPEDTF